MASSFSIMVYAFLFIKNGLAKNANARHPLITGHYKLLEKT